MTSNESNETMVDECLQVIDQVGNEWECDFIQDVHDLIHRGCNLSTAQQDKLEQVYQKVCRSEF